MRFNWAVGLVGCVPFIHQTNCSADLIVMIKSKRLIAFLCLLFFSCGQPETEVIALIGDEKITAAELRDFAERREKRAIRVSTAIPDTSDSLQQLIARRLLLLEARKVGMAADSVFVRRLEQQRRDAVIESYLERQIDAKIVVTAEDILQEYYDENWNRGLKFIYSARATKAAAVEDLAAEKSILSLPGYVLKDQVNEQVADELFALPVGSISPALPLAIKADTVFVAFKVLDEKRVPLVAVRQLIERRLRSRIRAKMERALGISLRDKYATGTPSDFRTSDSSSVGPDSARISDLYYTAARQSGIDAEPELQAKLRTIAEDVLLSYYLEQIDISPTEARSYFARHPDQFPAYEAITITEIVVHNRKLAQDLRLAIAQGCQSGATGPHILPRRQSKQGARKAQPIYHAINALRARQRYGDQRRRRADGVGRKVLRICRSRKSAGRGPVGSGFATAGRAVG